jgi:acyl-CoA thioesterase
MTEPQPTVVAPSTDRALARRALHARDGRLIATMAQEHLIPSP